MYWRDLEARVCAHLATAKRAAVIVAPFIKRGSFERLLAATPADASVRVFTRWRVEEVASGVSDPQIFELVESRTGAELRLCDTLHAKLYLVDGTHALIGSANVTAAGLGVSARPNLELLQAAAPSATVSALFLAELRSQSRLATKAEMEAVLAASAALRQSAPVEFTDAPEAQIEEDDAADPTIRPWLPTFRSPERLFALGADPEWLERAGPRDAALRDLAQIDVSPAEGEAVFDAAVRAKLRASELVRRLDAFLSEPRRFGQLTDWLRGVLPEADHEARQTAAQTLIRWLTYFDPERYRVDVPGDYSEVLSLRH